MRQVFIQDMLLADDAAVSSPAEVDLKGPTGRFSQACQKKTNVMAQDVDDRPTTININDYVLEVVHEFMYLESTIADNFSLEAELDKCIGRASTTLSMLTKRVWNSNNLTVRTKMQVDKACVVSTLLYSSEPCTLYS